MSANNQNYPETNALIVPGANEQLVKQELLTTIARRSFLASAMIGMSAIAIHPWDSVLASNQVDCKQLVQGLLYRPQKRGFWATVLGLLDLGASLFGFGGIVRSVQTIVRNVIGNRRQIAEAAIRAALGSLGQQLPFNVLNPPQSPWNQLGFTPLMNELSSDLRFLTQALSRDKFNGATLFFDHNDATVARDFDPKGIISAPTTHALMISKCVFEALGYRGADFKNAILAPADQKDSGRAMGKYDQDYARNDTYMTKAKATIDVAYSNVSDNDNGGTGEGEIAFHGLDNRSASNKRMGIRRVAFNFTYTSLVSPDGTSGFQIRYAKGFTQSRL